MFDSLSDKLDDVFRRLKGEKSLSEDNMKEALRQVRMALLESDVNYLVVKEFVARIREQALGQEVPKNMAPAEFFHTLVHKELVRMMQGGDEAAEEPEFIVQPGKDNIVLLLGLQGAGKTTFSGKLATYLRDKKCRPMLVACDIYRPAAIEQLKQVGGSLGIPVFEMGTEHKPVDIVRAAQKKAKESGQDTLIIDTAGRLHIDEVKMDELHELRDKLEPDYTFLVADAMTGQDAVNSAKTFDEQVGIDGVCLTKLDGDARGGAALSIKAVTGKPVVFVGVGEKPTDLEKFHPDRVAKRILNIGDIDTLLEKAQEAFDETEALSLHEKLGSGEFNYNDFIKQMKTIGKMGSLKGLLGLLPGVGSMLKQVDNEVLTKEFSRVESMIHSMTEKERENPDLISKDGKRRDRIARGSGHTLKQVNELVKQFEQMRGVMQQFAGGGMMGSLKGMMGGGGMPDPSAILGGGGGAPAGLPGPGGMPMMPGMPGYKKMQKQMKLMERQNRSAQPRQRPKKKRRKKR